MSQFNWINSYNLDTFSPLQKIDLLYISNTLDHLENLFAVLSKISSRVKNIYIKFHDSRGGAQHPYFLQRHSINYIATELNLKLKIFGVDNEYLLTS